MSIPDCADILAWLNDPNGGGDLPSRNAFISRNRKFIAAMREIVEEEDRRRWNVGFESIDQITCMQTTLWDNWPRFDSSGKKEAYKSFRWGLQIDAWTCRPEAVRLAPNGWQRHYIGNFKTAEDVLEQAEKAMGSKVANPISQDYFEVLMVATQALPDWHFAMLEHKAKGDGTIFPDRQLVMIDLDPATKSIKRGKLLVGSTVLELPPFSNLDINGKPYAGKKLTFRKTKGSDKRPGKVVYDGQVVCQSRYAIPTPNNRFRTFQTGNALAKRIDELKGAA